MQMAEAQRSKLKNDPRKHTKAHEQNAVFRATSDNLVDRLAAFIVGCPPLPQRGAATECRPYNYRLNAVSNVGQSFSIVRLPAEKIAIPSGLA